MTGRVIVDLCDIDFNKLHELETGTFVGDIRRNEPGQWRVEFQLDEVPPATLTNVNAVLVRDGTRVLFPGYRTAAGGGLGGTMREIDSSGRRGSIEGVDCWYWLTSRMVFPDPATDEPWTVAQDVRAGQGGTVITGFIEDNAGVSALTDRQIPGLTVQASAVGTNGEWSDRLQPLSALVRRVALESGLVVEPTLTNDLNPFVYIRQASDRTASVVVADISDLAFAEQRDVPPASTWVLAAGQGEGTARMFRSAGGGGGVNRIEKLTEQINATTSNELHQIAEAHRREDGFAFYVSGRTNEQAAEQFIYKDDYELGDLISVQVQDDRFPVPVTAVQISVTPERTVQTPTFGIYTPDRLRGMKRDILGLAERFDQNIT